MYIFMNFSEDNEGAMTDQKARTIWGKEHNTKLDTHVKIFARLGDLSDDLTKALASVMTMQEYDHFGPQVLEMCLKYNPFARMTIPLKPKPDR